MKVILELQDQPSNVRRVTVRHDIVIGRGSDCNLRLSSPQVSRRHCFLRVGREGVSVTDLDSSNGTYVDGKRIKPGKRYDLVGGSALAVGPIKFVVHIREEVVAAEILKNGAFSSAGDADAGRRDSELSIAVESFDIDDSGDAERPMNLAIEQAGASFDSQEPTEEMKDDADLQPEAFVRYSRQRPELLDSRAEIIDLGRRIAELDAQVAARNASADTLRTKSAGKPAEQPAAAANDLILADPDLLQVVDDEVEVVVIDDSIHGAAVVTEDDVIEIFDDPEVLDDDDEAVDDVEEIVSAEEVVGRDESAVESSDDVIDVVVEREEVSEVEVISDTDSGSSWFEGPAQDETDIDPDLQKFLKGL